MGSLLVPRIPWQDTNAFQPSMPQAHPSTPLLKIQAPVHYNNKEMQWASGYNMTPPYAILAMRLDLHAYDTFRSNAKMPRYCHLDGPEESVEAYFHVCTDSGGSSVDIINLDTLTRLGYSTKCLIEPSIEGRKFFREAGMSLKGALFVELRNIDPNSQAATYTSSLMYVAACKRNHLSLQTSEALNLRQDQSLGDLNPVNLPQNL